MSPGNQVLSQAEIDALLSGQAQEPDSPAKTFKVTPAASIPEATTGPQPHAGEELLSLKNTIAELTFRLNILESAAREATPADVISSKTDSVISQLQQSLRTLLEQVQVVSRKVKEMETNLAATPGYQAHKIFTCGSCHSTGLTAIRAKCTQCGKEFWWGLQPE